MQRHKIELFCWTSLLTLVVLSCARLVPWWSTAAYAIALAVLMRIWVFALRRGLQMFARRYWLAADTVRESCSPDVVRKWAVHDDEIASSHLDDDDDDDEGDGEHVVLQPV